VIARALVVAGGVLVIALIAATPALARDVTVTSFDGTKIVAHFSPASARAPNEPVPTVLVGPGYPTRGDMNPDQDTSDNIGQASLRAAGYNVLTWDPRGTGASTGTITFDSPDFEARDVQALLDYVAAQPEALLDGLNDPRVGMSGSSYGGGIQLAVAAIDHRVDAIIPDVTWNSLGTSFFPDGSVKTGWSVLICGNGIAAGLPQNLIGPTTAVLANAEAPLKASCLESVGGRVSPGNAQWWIDRTPAGLRERVAAPTLITHGTIDTLFSLKQAVANYQAIRGRGVPLKMLWHCTGHGTCLTSLGEPGHVRAAGLAWFDRWLKRNPAADTGPGFEWLADDGVWRSAPSYPPSSAGTIEATGSNFPSLGISPLDSGTSGTAFAATPAANAVNVTFSAPPAGSDIVGAPNVRLTYKGTSQSPNSYLFAQVVDAGAKRVVGSQATPIPVVLDDQEHTVERSLGPVAVHAREGARYRLQITPGTGLFSTQRSAGGVVIRRLDASLPLVTTGLSGSSLRTPRRLVLRVSSQRVNGATRLTIRTFLRSKPCRGRVTFAVTAAGRTARGGARVPSSCAIKRIFRLKVRSGARVTVAATFGGNNQLQSRKARTVSYRVP
jgi:ABC-2 type transport system ATP-binding protein